jgi:hypothetical protein
MINKLLPLLLVLYLPLSAQKMKIVDGNLNGLKGITSYNVKFTYNNLVAGAGIPERKYLIDMKTRWEEKEPGQGANFVRLWFNDRKQLYEPAFVKNFEHFSGIALYDSGANYTLLIKTDHIEGGWSADFLNCPAGIDGELWIVESADNNNVKAKIGFYNFSGTKFYGGDFEMTQRIESAYALAGKGLATS